MTVPVIRSKYGLNKGHFHIKKLKEVMDTHSFIHPHSKKRELFQKIGKKNLEKTT
jgi:hypothetical protein